ncbi:MAG TPA: NAD(P)-dependent oxidoreductase [Solirubrobacterales bacterium]|nr:NAD(P)-dependent oxidoreductase [Solirubrobacterales bacterium]
MARASRGAIADDGRVRVFVAGASGAIGRPLVRQLVAASHDVTGMTRRQSAAEEIRGDGAAAVVCDVFDTEALGRAVTDASPDVLVHQLTALPYRIDPRKADTYPATSRLRTEGTANLLAAARAAGARRFVSQSIAFLYAPRGPMIVDEGAPALENLGGHLGEAMEATLSGERQVLTADGVEGIVLRYGYFYGPGTSFAPDGSMAEDIRRRRFPIVGSGAGTMSLVHVEDAAAATVAACERGAPGIYNVCDDDPAPMREWIPVYADAIGAKPPFRVPVWLARVAAGKSIVRMATELRGASNAKAKRELGWEPRYPSWRQGFADALG